MVDREKVIKALERCATKGCGCDDEEGCPYNKGVDYTCVTELVNDALALLKAQEPRLMTLEEAQMSQMIEYRSGNTRDVGAEMYNVATEYYNKVWRVWTSRPTDEQREAEPWE